MKMNSTKWRWVHVPLFKVGYGYYVCLLALVKDKKPK
jgi:hypothetical protein